MEAGWDVLKLMKDRYSVRKFAERPIEREIINEILEAGHFAPTACNLQPQRILVIDDADALEKLRKCTRSHFSAPAALLVCYDKRACWTREYDQKQSGDIDASIVTTHMMLKAAQLGIGTTWVMHFIPEAVREEFKLPEDYEPTALLVMGYSASDAKPSPSHSQYKPAKEIVFYNRF